MTQPSETPTIVQKYVLVFDFCSSTAILEDLIRSEKLQCWQMLLIEVKKFLMEQESDQIEIYKFIGDGWIVLFSADLPVEKLLSFTRHLCEKYGELFDRLVKPVLASHVPSLGITFGLDRGGLSRVIMNSTPEYIGRFINVAARLQAAIKAEDENPGGKLLMPRHLYADMKHDEMKTYEPRQVVVNLNNVSGAEKYRGVLLTISDAAHTRSKPRLVWEDIPGTLSTSRMIKTERLVDCTFEIEFRIDEYSDDERNWFGVRLRGRGSSEDIFNGCLVYLRKNGDLDVRSIGGEWIVKTAIPEALRDGGFIRMKLSLIDETISVWINEDLMISPTDVHVLRAGNIYLQANKSRVSIKSARLLEENALT